MHGKYALLAMAVLTGAASITVGCVDSSKLLLPGKRPSALANHY